MALDLNSLVRATDSYRRAVAVACSDARMAGLDADQKDTIRAGVIQNFEFTYELCWKFMKRWLDNSLGSSQVDGVTRRELFRLAAEHQLIEDVDQWMLYHDARNEVAHTYDRHAAQEVFRVAETFLPVAERLLQHLEMKND
jgi:nucleotidyltransferase substrate binding protein (TIGR01987 family)